MSPGWGTKAYRWTDGQDAVIADTLMPCPWPRGGRSPSQDPHGAPVPGLPLSLGTLEWKPSLVTTG